LSVVAGAKVPKPASTNDAYSLEFLEMKLARQAAAMEELATTIWRHD
jgi:hypothetical protein